MKGFNENDLAKHAFRFWFSDHEHIRTPFPFYIHDDLKQETVAKFQDWVNGLHIDASEEVDEEMMAEKFEQIMFESALPLIKTEDERISILYPFLPRLGDALRDDQNKESQIVDRMLNKDGDHNYLKVICQNKDTKEKWETSFELTI